MTLQASGAISFSDLQTEYGDTGSISASQLYRGGSIVPSEVFEEGSYTAYQYNPDTTLPGGYQWLVDNNQDYISQIRWDGPLVSGSGGAGTAATTELVSGDYRYNRGAFQKFGVDPLISYYSVRRRFEGNVPANTTVPENGTIDLSDFYGGRGS